MAKLDLILLLIGGFILAVGCWLARTPFDYFITFLLVIFAPFSVVSWIASGTAVERVMDDIGKIREGFGGMLK